MAEDWDEDALLTVLNIIHLRNKHVPGAISLEHLAMVGVIDDYYEFGEAIEMFTALWLQNIRRQCIPSEYCRELILWIWVPFVFDMPAGFEKATLAAVYFATEAVQVLGLPIPKTVAGKLFPTAVGTRLISSVQIKSTEGVVELSTPC